MKQSECLVRHWRGTSVLRRVSSLPSRSEMRRGSPLKLPPQDLPA